MDKTFNLKNAIKAEIARVATIAEVLQAKDNLGRIAAEQIEADVLAAEKTIENGDVLGLIEVYNNLREWIL